MELIKKEELHTARWSGGTTTELGIYPKDGDYSAREFKWRVSSAVVEVEESEFTSLPGVNRILMILEGELRLIHEGHHSCILKKYDQDSFMGDWKTKSFGRVTDFNLMIKGVGNGRIDTIYVKPNGMESLRFKKSTYKNNHTIVYITKGCANIQDLDMKAFDTILFDDYIDRIDIINPGKEDLEIVIAKILFD